MKHTNYILALFLGLTFLTTACANDNGKHRHHKEHFMPVKCYHTHNVDNGDLWLYMMVMNNNSSATYYTMSSPIPITNYSSTTWVATPSMPSDIKSATLDPSVQVVEESVAVSEFDPAFSVVINENAEYFDGMTTEEMGDYEGGGEAKPENTESESNSDTSSSSDSGSDGGGGGSDGGGSE